MRTKMHRAMMRRKFSKKGRVPERERMHIPPRLLSGETTQLPIGLGNRLTPKAPTLDEPKEE